MPTIRVAIVEDTAQIRESFQALINAAEGFACEHAFADAETALRALPTIEPDVMLVDIELPGMSGIEFVRRAKLYGASLRTQFIICTVFEDADKIFDSLAAGATGYLVKKTSSHQLVEAIREVHEGGAPMSMQVARKVVTHFNRLPETSAIAPLTKRQREILDYLARGLLYKEIADKLSISQGTVHVHIHNIYEKLHVSNRTEAINKVFPCTTRPGSDG